MGIPVFISEATLRLFENQLTTAHRVATWAGGWIERFEDAFLISSLLPSEADTHRLLLEWCQNHQLPCTAIFHRVLLNQPKEATPPEKLFGESDTRQWIARENGLKFHLHFNGYSSGLFIDQRENRAFLRSQNPHNVLNLFSYTCAFSIAGAAAGATTTSVDLSERSLAVGKKNLELNNLSPQGHKFVTEDARRYLHRLAKRGEKFDCVILDPPTFSRSKQGGIFQVEKEMQHLIELILPCLNPKGSILLSTNCRTLSPSLLMEMAQSVFGKHRKKVRFDHAPRPLDIPAHDMPTTVWAFIE